MTQQLQKLPVCFTVTHAHDTQESASLLFHWQKQPKFTLCYGDHLGSTKDKYRLKGPQSAKVLGEKKGLSFKTELKLVVRRGCVGWTLTLKLTQKTKASSPGEGGFAWARRISKQPSKGALLDLGNCLQRSPDTSRQMPLPIKHSVACSFTPQQLLSDSKKRSKYVSDDSPTPPNSNTSKKRKKKTLHADV